MKNKQAKSIFSSLENFSSIPPPELWDAIEAQLDQPKKKKRAIIWWSIAASLLVGLSVPTILHFNSNPENWLEMNDGNVNSNSNSNNNFNSNFNFNNNFNNNFNGNDNFNENTNPKLNDKPINLNSGNQVVTTTTTISSKTKNESRFNNFNNSTNIGRKTKVKNSFLLHAIVANQIPVATSLNSVLISEKKEQVNNSNENEKVVVSEGKNNFSVTGANKAVATSKNSNSDQFIKSNTNSKSVVSSEKNPISGLNVNEEILENASSKDSLNKIKREVAQLENVLVQLDKDKTTKKKDAGSIDKWSVQVFAGVMSSQNYNNEKALGNTVSSKESNGYGVKTNYKLNKKWGVSSGFKINELGQKIAGVSYYEQQSFSGVLTGKLVFAKNNNEYYSPNNNDGLVSISNNEGYLFASNPKADNGLEKGDVTQNLKYFEVPLEVSYALLSKKKTNISMNTGGFVGMLISNNLLLDGNSIGETKNVNKYVYGTLLSSTLQYEIYKKTKFFVEPGMNYYINPLENQVFNQFQWMFNVGLNVSF
jgi:hypothetical protein